MNLALSAVRVFVDDLAAARPFYERVLALPLRHDRTEMGWCVFDAGGPDLVLESVPAQAPADERVLVGRFTGLSFRVADIGADYRRLVNLGVVFSGAPEQQAWGGWLATCLDPAGNQLQLVQLPG